MTTDIQSLCQSFASLSDTTDIYNFLQDLLTPGEISEFAQRLAIANKLQQGQRYKDIEQETGASSTTVARVAKCLHGPIGGYKKTLSVMKK